MNETLKAPKVINYIRLLGRGRYYSAYTYDPVTNELLDELFALLGRIEKNKKSDSWKLWLKAERGTIEDFGDYNEWLAEGEVESYEEFEERWKEEYPDEVEWFAFQAFWEKEIDYRAVHLRHRQVIEQDPRKDKGFEYDISEFVSWMVGEVRRIVEELEKDNYNSDVQKNLPAKHHIGYVLRKHVWEIYPKQELAITGILTEQDIAYFLEHAKDTVPDETRMSRMTANDFYRFCAIGYDACEYRSPEKSPKERYYLFADGRDEGLGKIDPDDPTAFEEWFNGGRLWGGHPWEVCSGGSSTHIDLDVLHDEGGWYLELAGSAWTRCAETVKFFVSLHKAGVPISVYQAELLKKRILGEEKVGIVPDGIYPSYCRDFFAEQDIIDYMSLPHDSEMEKRLEACCVFGYRKIGQLQTESTDFVMFLLSCHYVHRIKQ